MNQPNTINADGSSAGRGSAMIGGQRLGGPESKRRYGRRTLVHTSVVAAGAAAFLAACGGDKESDEQSSGSAQPASATAATTQAAAPQPGGILREATITQ